MRSFRVEDGKVVETVGSTQSSDFPTPYTDVLKFIVICLALPFALIVIPMLMMVGLDD